MSSGRLSVTSPISVGFGMQSTIRQIPYWLMFSAGEKMRFSASERFFWNPLAYRSFTPTTGALTREISIKKTRSEQKKHTKDRA